MCRYLVNQPVSELDRAHSVRACIGNGTRANVHEAFTKRFGVKLMEIYAASEGNCILSNLWKPFLNIFLIKMTNVKFIFIVNTVAKLGACGYIPRINQIYNFLPTFIIKIDEDGNPIRNSKGLCIHCVSGEKGLIVGLIDQRITRQQYSGYANQPDDSSKKIIKNLFKLNQTGFNTGLF